MPISMLPIGKIVTVVGGLAAALFFRIYFQTTDNDYPERITAMLLILSLPFSYASVFLFTSVLSTWTGVFDALVWMGVLSSVTAVFLVELLTYQITDVDEKYHLIGFYVITVLTTIIWNVYDPTILIDGFALFSSTLIFMYGIYRVLLSIYRSYDA